MTLISGVEGGFDADTELYEKEECNSLVVLPEWKELLLTDPSVPARTRRCAEAILKADSANRREEAAALSNTWEGEPRIVSR